MTASLSIRPSRRDRRRVETIGDIKAAARAQLASGGPTAISLRGIARELDIAASAVHYYFASRQALVDALIIDGFRSLAADLRVALDRSSSDPPGEQWLTVTRAHRAWALQRPSEYLLIYGHDGGDAKAKQPLVRQAMSGVVGVLIAVMRNAVLADDIATEILEAITPAPLREQLVEWRAAREDIGELPEGALVACMITYAQLHGAITLELVSHIPPALTDRSALFDLEMAHAYTAIRRQSDR